MNEQDIEFINDILMEYGNDDSVLDVSELDGFLTAIVSGPEMIPLNRWLPEVWGGAANEPEWESEAEVRRFMDLVFEQMNQVAEILMEYPSEFQALFLSGEFDGKETFNVDEWCEGYMRGVQLSETDWEKGDPNQLMEHLAAISFFAGDDFIKHRLTLDSSAIEKLQQKVEPAARALHAYWLQQRSPSAIENIASVNEMPKTGRNDPCPCGSGKKFKKCCLH